MTIVIVIVCALAGFGVVYNVLPSRRSASNSSANENSRRSSANESSQSSFKADANARTPRWAETLGVSPLASAIEIRTAYRDLIRQYHPDKFETAAPEIKAYAATKAQEINSAYAEAGISLRHR